MKPLRSVLVVFLACLFYGSVSPAEVVFQGLLPDHLTQIKDEFPGIATRNLRPHEVDQVLHLLMKEQDYEDLRAIRRDDGAVIFQGTPLKKIAEININGNRRIDDSTLQTALALKAGGSFNVNQIRAGAEKIKELYGRQGYFNASISFSYSDKDPTQTVLDISVIEGEPCRVTSIQFESKNKALSQMLQARTKGYRNDIFTENLILDIEKNLDTHLREKRYLNAKVEQKNALYNPQKTRATLIYRVLDVYKYEVVFNGNKSYSNSDFRRLLNLDSFDSGSVSPGSDIQKTIIDQYISSGYAFAKVQFEEDIDEKNFVRRLTFNISEGPRVKIKEFNITGRLSRSPDFYSKFIKNNSSEAIDDGLYVRSGVEIGLRNLIAQLNNEGFLRSRVQSVRYEFLRDNKEVIVKVVLDEGPLTQLRAIAFEGNTAFTSEALLSEITLKPNEPLNLESLELSIGELIRFYQDNGYIEMRLENRDNEFIRYDEKGAQANVVFKIFEGPKVRLQTILVEGNTFTRTDVILRRLELTQGEILSVYKIEEAKRRLELLGIFSRVELRTLEANTKVEDRTLIVSVSEQDPGIFRIGFGVNNQRELTLRGFTGASYNNIKGSARAISGRLDIQNSIKKTDYNEYEASVSYLEPFIIRSKFRGRVNFTRQEKVTDWDSDYRQLTVRKSDKLAFIAERDITSNIRFSWTTWSFETVREFNHGELLTPFTNSEQKIATVGPIIDFDFRDNPLLPTRGFFVRVESDYSDPGIGSSSKINFIRGQSTVSHYLPLFIKDLIWANSVRGGYGRNLSDEENSGIPSSYAFFLGGFTTMRGYAGTPNDRIPSEIQVPTNENRQLIVPKETSYYLIKSEIRFPIYGIIGGVLFTDIGNVKINRDSDKNYYDGPTKQTYGLGIRINTPVGPLTLDYARKRDVNREIDESPDQWHLSIGTF